MNTHAHGNAAPTALATWRPQAPSDKPACLGFSLTRLSSGYIVIRLSQATAIVAPQTIAVLYSSGAARIL